MLYNNSLPFEMAVLKLLYILLLNEWTTANKFYK